MVVEAQVTGEVLAQDSAFIHNAEDSIAAGLERPQNAVEVIEINVGGRRLSEESNASLTGRRLRSYLFTLIIQYKLYLSYEDEASEIRTKLLTPDHRHSFAQTLAIELDEKERAQQRGVSISSLYISTAL